MALREIIKTALFDKNPYSVFVVNGVEITLQIRAERHPDFKAPTHYMVTVGVQNYYSPFPNGKKSYSTLRLLASMCKMGPEEDMSKMVERVLTKAHRLAGLKKETSA